VGINTNGNSLHGGNVGFNQQVWTARPGTSAEGQTQTLTLSYLSKDGEEGYPGNLHVTVVYTFTADNALKIDHTATTDKATPVNLTNHAYFNLALGPRQDVLAHVVTIPADRYTVVDAKLIPTGELRPVAGTPFDFRTPHAIGARIAQVPGGYDHNWVLSNPTGQYSAATVYEPTTGRTMEVTTDEPGVQFYTGNFLNGSLTGKGGGRVRQARRLLPRNPALPRLAQPAQVSEHHAEAGRDVPHHHQLHVWGAEVMINYELEIMNYELKRANGNG